VGSDGSSRVSSQKQAPEVGIVYLVRDELWIDATPIARAMNVGGYVIHERDHQWYWKQLVKQKAVTVAKYDRYPRGRVSYNRKSGKFTLLADRCILSEKSFVGRILMQMNLPARGTETGTDSLYRCLRCLLKS